MATHSIILTWRIPWTTLSSVPGLLIVPLLVPRTPPHSQLLPSPSCLLPGRVLLTFSSVYVSSALGSFSCLLPQFLLRGYLPSLAHLSRCTEVVFLLDCKLFEVRNRWFHRPSAFHGACTRSEVGNCLMAECWASGKQIPQRWIPCSQLVFWLSVLTGFLSNHLFFLTLTFCDLFPCYFWSEWESIIALKGCFVHHFDDKKGWYPHPLICHKMIAFNLWSLWIQSLISVSGVHVQITQQCLNPSSVHPATRVFSFTSGMKAPNPRFCCPVSWSSCS